MTHWRPLSAYQNLQPAERAFCDAIVREMESMATSNGHPISLYLTNGFDVPPHVAARDTKDMMSRDRVKNAVWERLNDIALNLDLTEYRWYSHINAIATSNIGNYIKFDENGDPYQSIVNCTPEMMSAIKTLKIKSSAGPEGDILGGRPVRTEVEITLHPKLDALKMQGEYAGYLRTDAPQMRADRTNPSDPIRTDDTPEQAGERYAALLEGK